MTTWRPEEEPTLAALTAAGWIRALLRGLALGLLTSLGLVAMLLARLVERPLCGAARPVTPFITQAVCRLAFLILGMGYVYRGQPMAHRGAIVANHSSWLDIFALNACQRVYFVSKAEVSRWPFIGWLARATGTVFIERDPRRARAQQAEFEARLRAGHRLLFFPEGTSTDGMRVLPFKSTLFQAFYTHGLEHVMQIQPVTVAYHAPEGADKRFYGWWGEMDLAPHLLHTLAARRQGRVEVIFHLPVSVDAFGSRKALAIQCEQDVRAGLVAALGAAIDPTDC
ncbi:lysophospholipid acyltransferase family protein [Frigidibacter sp. RF13]|uniref:lysophospholipid acyltransferase family protein n=1 Tax=Frigidibacter sp. RF13 TaxID=2997340 RepID=UPI00226F4349|nr:lysophospholipid acyltransferase family protein [Frigidibacter sp. RF13]MCY1125709.1 lysophospholipid acyltransferase family protein [Frigidibacter sp. RF13]